MRAFVDQELCIGCSMCTMACPAVFELNGEGRAEVVADTNEENREEVMTAIEGCPVGAIREEE